MGISIEDIRNVIEEKAPLREVLQKQNDMLNGQIADLNRAKILCEKMLDAENMEYDDLKVEQYVTELEDYWNDNRPVFKVDSVSFLYIWGSFVTWAVITIVCLLTALLSYANLPQEIPVQWSDGQASSLVNKIFIFAYPAVCIVIRYLIRPVIYAKLRMNNRYEEIIAEYLSNYMCFIALSAEVFSVLFIYGVVKNIVAVLAVDTAVFIGLLIAGLIRMDLKGDW